MAQELPPGDTMPSRPSAATERMKSAYEKQLHALEQGLEERERHLGVLAEVAAAIHGAEDQQRILDVTIDVILRGLGLETAWIFLGDQKERKLHLAACRGVSQRYLDEGAARGLEECLCPE